MSFRGYDKDVLVFDFESTGFIRDPETGEVTDAGDPTQLGAILLDKATLVEKDSFTSDIKADPERLDPWVLKHTDITAEKLAAAPEPSTVAQQFVDQFGTDFYLASWNVTFDRFWLQTLLSSIQRTDAMYDYHHLDVWSVAYTYLCQLGHPEIKKSEPTFKAFGQSGRQAHTALDDCRRTAEVLRAVVNHKELSL